MSSSCELPDDIRVFERGWLSSNNILLLADTGPALIDSGYATHETQTLALVESALDAHALSFLLNTHLHSDHCGGNAILQARYPDLQTLIPPGHADEVRRWDTTALTYGPTGQLCRRFSFDATLIPGSTLRLGQRDWQVHTAPGHDPHSVMLFEPELRVLISADALWEKGFGVVFPEIEGLDAFEQVADTLDLIESLNPKLAIPGHGRVFDGVTQALEEARQRLNYFIADPQRHAQHAAKVLIKFKLLEVQRCSSEDFQKWVAQTSYFSTLHQTYFKKLVFASWIDSLLSDLVRSRSARLDGDVLVNC
jgi:glyoxylase-like metal-dependent hydrolase (beta-lactamase superfamily II)